MPGFVGYVKMPFNFASEDGTEAYTFAALKLANALSRMGNLSLYVVNQLFHICLLIANLASKALQSSSPFHLYLEQAESIMLLMTVNRTSSHSYSAFCLLKNCDKRLQGFIPR
jgi:hypothetical protein